MDADIDDWKYSPYNCFKARIYIELSSLLVFVFQFTRISPNQITLMYTISGVLGGIFLSLNNNTSALIACLIFILKVHLTGQMVYWLESKMKQVQWDIFWIRGVHMLVIFFYKWTIHLLL